MTRGLVGVVVVMCAMRLSAAAPPTGYQCYPGKPKIGVGCSCPGDYREGRDGEGTAHCKVSARPPLEQSKRDLKLIAHAWPIVNLPPAAPPPPKTPRVKAAPITTPAPAAKTTGPTDREVELLRRQLATTTGTARFPIWHRLVEALTTRAYAAPVDFSRDARSSTPALDSAFEESTRMIAADGFASYAKADLALFGHADLAHAAGKSDAARATLARLIKDYPASIRIPDAYLWIGERAFEAQDLAAARQAYEKVLSFTASTVAAYASYKLGWVHYNEGKYLDAKRRFEEAIKDQRLKRSALRDLARVYVSWGSPDKVFDYFDRLDPVTAIEHMRDVAEGYADIGKGLQARIVFRDLVIREQDPARICNASMGALRGSLQANSRSEIMLDVDAFAQVAAAADAECKQSADELLGELGLALHREVAKTKGDARDAIAIWRHALAMATTADRRQAIERNLATALWLQAATAGGARPIDWIVVGDALHASPARDLSDVAIDAYDNAIRAARGTNQRLAPLIVARLRGALVKIPGDRAKQLLAELR